MAGGNGALRSFFFVLAGERRGVVRTPTLHWNTSLGARFSPENKRGFHYSEGDIPADWSLAPESVAR